MSESNFDPSLQRFVGGDDGKHPIQNNVDLWHSEFPRPQPQGNKYSRGHALICGGGLMTGATRLAARAAQRIGAGLVTLAAPPSAVSIYAETLESVIIRPVEGIGEWSLLVNQPKTDVILIGPGLGIGDRERTYILEALQTLKPIVLDADVFTNFAEHSPQLLAKLHANCVLTPHEGEFSRLFHGHIQEETDKVARARKAAHLAGCVVLLKGAETVIANSEGIAVVNNNAPPWLATAGAGDVLAGMILGLIAQKMPVFYAAMAGAWLHGKIATDFGLGLIAEDLVDGIPKVLQNL